MNSGSIMTATRRPNPYVGPRSYMTGETLYGRDREREELLDLLIAERIVLLYSPSGAGKTSLIQAGLVPELTQEGFRVLPTMRVSAAPSDVVRDQKGISKHSRNRYLLSLLLSLEATLPEAEQTPSAELPMTLNAYLERRYPVHDGNENLVLIFDQFEEILTLDPTDQIAKAEFFAEVGDVLRDRNRWALFAMREEFVTALDPYARLVPTRLTSTFRLDLLGVDAAMKAVRLPAEAAGSPFTAAAAEKLVSNLRRTRVQEADGKLVESLGPTVEPVQLQVVCRRLWERLPPDATLIDERDVDDIGDVDSALRGYYAESVAAIAIQTGVRERALRDWIERQLITNSGIRGQVLQDKDESAGLSNVAISALMDVHLVRAEKRRGATWFELVHDRLIEPVRADNAEWRTQHLTELQRRADLWRREDRPSGLLMVGEELAEAEAWAKAHGQELEDYEKAFLEASREAQTRRQRERRLMIGMGVLTVVALVAALVALFFFQDAQVQANAAREAEGKAVTQAEVAQAAEARAEQAQATAEVRRIEAERQSSISRAQVVRSQSQLQRSHNAECSLTLALDAYDLAVVIPDIAHYPFEDAVRDALMATHIEQVLPVSGTLNAVDWSHDGRSVAAGSDLGVQVWTMSDNHADTTVRLDSLGAVQAVAFSPDDAVLAAGGADIVLWDQERDEVVETFFGHDGLVRTLAWHPAGRWLASGGADGLVIIWDMQERQAVATLRGHQDWGAVVEVSGLAWSPNGDWLASSGFDNNVRIWDATKLQDDGAVDRALTEVARWGVNQYGQSSSLAWSPDGRQVASGQAGGAILVWSLDDTSGFADDQPPTRILEGHTASVIGLAWSGDGALLASSAQDQTIRLWDGRTLAPLDVFTGHSDAVQAVAWHPDSTYLASASFDTTVRIWRMTPGGVQVKAVDGSEETYLLDAAWHPSRDIVAIATTSAFSSLLLLWDLENSTTRMITAGHTSSIQRIAWSPNGEQIATASADSEAHIYDAQNGSLERRFTGHQGALYDLAWSYDGSRLASGSHTTGENVRVWTVEDGSSRSFTGSANIVAVAWRPDRGQVAAGTVPGTINLWDVATGERHDLTGAGGAVLALAWHSSGQWLASGLQNGHVTIWEVVDDDLGASHIWKDDIDVGEQIWDLAWRDNLLAVAAVDGPVRVWDVLSGENIANLQGHVGPVRAVGWSADGRYIATVGMLDGTARVHYADFTGDLLPIARRQAVLGSTEAERQRCRAIVN